MENYLEELKDLKKLLDDGVINEEEFNEKKASILSVKNSDSNMKTPNIFEYYVKVLKKYADPKGRASRREYLSYFLVNLIISFSLGFLEGLFDLFQYTDDSVLALVYSYIVLLPGIFLGIRRMHDHNKSGWYLLIPIYNIILLLTKGDSDQNDYGAPERF